MPAQHSSEIPGTRYVVTQNSISYSLNVSDTPHIASEKTPLLHQTNLYIETITMSKKSCKRQSTSYHQAFDEIQTECLSRKKNVLGGGIKIRTHNVFQNNVSHLSPKKYIRQRQIPAFRPKKISVTGQLHKHQNTFGQSTPQLKPGRNQTFPKLS